MGNVIESFSHTQDQQPIIDEVKKIAKREKRSQSQIIVSALEEYVKAHGKGNDSYKLETFEKGFAAYPTPWKPIGFSDLKAYSWKEEDEMVSKLEKALATIKMDRQTKRDSELHAKGINLR